MCWFLYQLPFPPSNPFLYYVERKKNTVALSPVNWVNLLPSPCHDLGLPHWPLVGCKNCGKNVLETTHIQKLFPIHSAEAVSVQKMHTCERWELRWELPVLRTSCLEWIIAHILQLERFLNLSHYPEFTAVLPCIPPWIVISLLKTEQILIFPLWGWRGSKENPGCCKAIMATRWM